MQYYQIQLIAWLNINTRILSSLSSLIFKYYKLFENILLNKIICYAYNNHYKRFNLIIKVFVYYKHLYNNYKN